MSLKDFILSKLFFKNLGKAVIIVVFSIMVLLIWLNIYTRHGQARPVPDFTGLSLEQTARLAKKSRLRYEINDSVYTSLVGRGCVAEQTPRPGFKVKKWRTVIITINAFSPEMTAMPNLIDLPKRQALSLIESSGLQTGVLKYKPDLSIDVVLEQQFNGRKIAPGDSIQKGSLVDLVLGKGLSDQRASVPDCIGLHLISAKNIILASSLNLGTYIYDSSIVTAADSAQALVYKQNPEYREDATLQLGSPVYLWMTVDSAKLPVDSTTINLNDSLPDIDSIGEIPN
jgi:eukaryotic-like serine/threonine-protein kinase